MKDLVIRLNDKPGALADMGEALASAGVSVEGGGAWVVNSEGVAHFLVEDGEKARMALEEKGIEVVRVNETLVQRLKQDQPGQLGKITRAMEKAGVNIEVLYSDHDNQLILVVDDYEKGKVVSDNWTRGVYA
ncbi:amino acid-binding ACT domain-containing protein [Fulvivirga sp. 29W222]|uniref:Amino acid-binding ACT domain-containing protein n=1 Tax=Fulvivirga marina TaxID=2494733 RepID=A0A937KCG3_9BACT|nr:amino acid-binding ACT domain-containing protein [Fulvivirga marina]MBL6447349.1 amino acid-binding ACT domain-containing protein [Fulvivirga marina]